mmetsp:Transcript_2385/g.3718  ORF Transcript_2385/g.3718 Transcript_2385/m.3718 type:complete len:173 (-) Transcript_2385:625-1143(-)
MSWGVCVLSSVKGVKGTIRFFDSGKETLIFGEVAGLVPGEHGFHIHEWGDQTNGCLSSGGHFNPYKKNHGAPTDTERHLGDLGNLQADEQGGCLFSITDQLVHLNGPHSVVGRTVVVHEGKDDLGRGGHKDSLKTGNAGGRVACGIIGTSTPPENAEALLADARSRARPSKL